MGTRGRKGWKVYDTLFCQQAAANRSLSLTQLNLTLYAATFLATRDNAKVIQWHSCIELNSHENECVLSVEVHLRLPLVAVPHSSRRWTGKSKNPLLEFAGHSMFPFALALQSAGIVMCVFAEARHPTVVLSGLTYPQRRMKLFQQMSPNWSTQRDMQSCWSGAWTMHWVNLLF